MTRFKLTIEYDGTPYVGWQAQNNGLSVQASLEEAVRKFCGEKVRIFAAGRTDAGVHALGQIAHVDIEAPHDADTVRDGLNFHLKPSPIAVLSAEEVTEDFHARFSALKRHYLYRIIARRAPVTLLRNRVWNVYQSLDVASMHEAAQCLVGKHDFTTFRASLCQAKSPVKTIDKISVAPVGDEIHMTVSARSFLHNQVRSFAGSLKMVGTGKWSAAELKSALEGKDRSHCGPVAPAHGLYLVSVDY